MAGKSKAAVAKGGVEKTKKTGKKAADAAAAATATATESSGKQKKAQKTPAKEEDIDDLFGKLKKTGPKAKDKVENDVNKNTNDGEQKSSKKKKGISNNSKVVGSKDDIFGTETGKGRKKTEEGFAIYTEDELGFGKKGGNTDLCPFDCDCCF